MSITYWITGGLAAVAAGGAMGTSVRSADTAAVVVVGTDFVEPENCTD
jgi:hypothetical protein